MKKLKYILQTKINTGINSYKDFYKFFCFNMIRQSNWPFDDKPFLIHAESAAEDNNKY
jgi:hypothetical protein